MLPYRVIFETLLPDGYVWKPKYIENITTSPPDQNTPELITNGEFETDISGWITGGDIPPGFIDHAAPEYMLFGFGESIYAEQEISTESGTTYALSFEIIAPSGMSGNTFICHIGTSQGASDLLITASHITAGVYDYDFVATSSSAWVRFTMGSPTATGLINLDNVSVKAYYKNVLRDGDLHLLLSAMGLNEERERAYILDLAHIRDPQLTPILSDLEKEYGIITNVNKTEQDRRDDLTGIVYARESTGNKDFLQSRLHAAGFTNLYVYDNAPAADPDGIVNGGAQIYCGDTLAQCGEDNAQCAWFQGELVVNGDIYNFYVDYVVRCGEALSQCGEDTALAGNYNGVVLDPILYQIPEKTYLFSETFISNQKIIDNGGTILGSPNPANYGIDILTTGQRIGYSGGYAPLTEITVIAEVDATYISGQRQTISQHITVSPLFNMFEFGFCNHPLTTEKHLYVDTNTINNESTATVPLGRHIVAATVDSSGDLTFYLDGVQLGNVISGVSIGTQDSNLFIGSNESNTLPLNGSIYDFKLFDYALTAEEIANYKKDQVLKWWNMFFFVGGGPAVRDPSTNEILSIPRVSIKNERRASLRNIILKYKPMHSWCGLVVSYV